MMTAETKNKNNLVVNLTEKPRIIAIKGGFYPSKIVFSIEIGNMVLSSKKFSRRAWSTYESATQTLENLDNENLIVIPNKIDYIAVKEEEGCRLESPYPTIYKEPIKTYYV